MRKTRPQLRLLLVGCFESGDPVPAVTREAIESDPGIVVTGFLDDPAVVYQLMDVVALPTYREGYPTVALEAAAAGRPFVTTAVTGAAESVEHGVTGLLAPPGDVAAFSRNVERLLADDAMRDRLGDAAARDARARFHDEDVARRTILLYERACGASSTAGAIDRAYADGPAARPSVIRRTRSGEGVGAP
jgi:glycosyltransferase involved in cell wall biosynthesis